MNKFLDYNQKGTFFYYNPLSEPLNPRMWSRDFLWVSLVLAYRGSSASTPVIPYIYSGAFNNFVRLYLLVGQN